MLSSRCGIQGYDYKQQTFTPMFLLRADKSPLGVYNPLLLNPTYTNAIILYYLKACRMCCVALVFAPGLWDGCSWGRAETWGSPQHSAGTAQISLIDNSYALHHRERNTRQKGLGHQLINNQCWALLPDEAGLMTDCRYLWLSFFICIKEPSNSDTWVCRFLCQTLMQLFSLLVLLMSTCLICSYPGRAAMWKCPRLLLVLHGTGRVVVLKLSKTTESLHFRPGCSDRRSTNQTHRL